MGKRQDIRQVSSQSDVYGMCISDALATLRCRARIMAVDRQRRS